MSAVIPQGKLGQGWQAALALGGNEGQFRRLLEKLPAGAYTCDPEGLITYYNSYAVQLWGRAPKLRDPIDRFCGSFKLFSPDGSPIAHEQCWMALALKTDLEYNGHEITIERPDGTHLPVLAHANPIHDESGSLVGAVNVLVDISERKRTEDVLKETDRTKNEFLATLAHELRNPLAPISNAVQILRREDLPSPESQWAVGVIGRQVQQLTRLVDDLLDFSRITTNRLELCTARIELTEVLRTATETSRPLIEAREQEFILSVQSRPIFLNADLTRLAQVIANLLNNASKFTPKRGHIRLIAEQHGREAVLTVQDTGIGIPPEMLPRIFDMFTHVDCSLGHSPEGLGIGLSLTKRLVEMHAGTLEAHSAGSNKGSTFVIRLPVVAEVTDQEPQKQAGEDAQSLPTSKRRILVVDDNKVSAKSLGMLLRMVGHEVNIANDGLEAVEAAAMFHPEVVVLDIGMPKLNGYEAARRIRAQQGGESIVLIALTGWGQEEDHRRSQAAGFNHHLTKPVELDALQTLL